MEKGIFKVMTVSIKNILSTKTSMEDRFISDYEMLGGVVRQLKAMGYKIVLTQGVYDLVHEGHALYLEKARSYGDILIVGVDSDAFTKARKGPNRPIVPESERLKMLVHFRHVDIVTLREVHHGMDVENSLIQIVNPDVLVLSSTTGDLPEGAAKALEKHCKKVVVLPPQATTSTTARVRKLTLDGADQFVSILMEKIPQLYRDIFLK